jgi:hypothetical protein
MTPKQIQQESWKRYPDTDSSLTNGLAKVQRVAFEKGSEFVLDRHAWVSVSERLPTKEDAILNLDEWVVEVMAESHGIKYVEPWPWEDVKDSHIEYWRTPLDNNFPQTESND